MSNAKQLYNAALMAYESGDFEEAERLGRKIIAESPEGNLAQAAQKFVRSPGGEGQAPPTGSVESGSGAAYSKERRNAASGAADPEPTGRYETARALASFFSLIGWLIVALGVLGAIPASEYGPIAIGMCVALSFIGLVQVMGGQMIRATVDTADNTLKILHVLKQSNR